MRTRHDCSEHPRCTPLSLWALGTGLVLLCAIATAPPAVAQQAAPEGTQQGPAPGWHRTEAPHSSQAADAPGGLPPPNFPTSPHRGVIDGWGKPIPCRCRFDGKSYQLGEIVCMSTHVGTVLTRCDIFGNNTSWMPSREPCVPKVGS